jgi:hypothetical protein
MNRQEIAMRAAHDNKTLGMSKQIFMERQGGLKEARAGARVRTQFSLNSPCQIKSRVKCSARLGKNPYSGGRLGPQSQKH